MYQWKPKRDGTDIVRQYIRHQDDYFHNTKLNVIRNRKNKFLFPKLPKKPSTSFQQFRKEETKTKSPSNLPGLNLAPQGRFILHPHHKCYAIII